MNSPTKETDSRSVPRKQAVIFLTRSTSQSLTGQQGRVDLDIQRQACRQLARMLDLEVWITIEPESDSGEHEMRSDRERLIDQLWVSSPEYLIAFSKNGLLYGRRRDLPLGVALLSPLLTLWKNPPTRLVTVEDDAPHLIEEIG